MNPRNGQDLYAILGVANDADFGEIKKAYKKKALELHPDKGGSDAAFQVLRNAYDVLSDPIQRLEYDQDGGYRAGSNSDSRAFKYNSSGSSENQAMKLSSGKSFLVLKSQAGSTISEFDKQLAFIGKLCEGKLDLRRLSSHIEVTDGRDLIEKMHADAVEHEKCKPGGIKKPGYTEVLVEFSMSVDMLKDLLQQVNGLGSSQEDKKIREKYASQLSDNISCAEFHPYRDYDWYMQENNLSFEDVRKDVYGPVFSLSHEELVANQALKPKATFVKEEKKEKKSSFIGRLFGKGKDKKKDKNATPAIEQGKDGDAKKITYKK